MLTRIRFLSRKWPNDVMMACGQCGHPYTDILQATSRTVRYSCRECGAVIRVRRSSEANEPAHPAAVLPDVTADPLAAFMPARMVRWVQSNTQSGQATATPDKPALTRWYADFDHFVTQARTSAEARSRFEEVSELPLEQLPSKPPPITKVMGALHGSSYDCELAIQKLTGGDTEPSYSAVVSERVRHIHQWFTTAGRATIWFLPPEDPCEAEPELVKELLGPDGLAGNLRGTQIKTFFAALFGVPKGPSARDMIAQFGEDRVRDALLGYLEDGSRPLRDALVANLDEDSG